MEINSIQKFFIDEVKKEWNSLLKSWDSRPWGVWIREYSGATENLDGFSVFDIPLNVWFLDEKGICQKEVNEFQRFVVIQTGLVFGNLGFSSFRSSIWSRESIIFHEIGLSSFAKIQGNKDKYYFDNIWGGRFGRGWSIEFDQNRIAPVWKNIWIS